MSISINKKNLIKESFKNERELQEHLYELPYLLMQDGDKQFYAIAREVRLPSAGILDILLMDESGTLIAVEVKLSRNGQSRREVVAQIFDYISDLSALSYHEIDDMVSGKLEEIAYQIDEEGTLPRTINSFLKNGAIKVIIAVDHVNSDLQRIMEFINERTNLDVRLIEISKYDEGNILVPKVIVEGNGDSLLIGKDTPARQSIEVLESLALCYNEAVEDTLRIKKSNKTYKMIFINPWPPQLHYELLHKTKKDSVGLELHNETVKLLYLQALLKNYDGQSVQGYKIIYDPNWQNGKGKIFIDVPYSIGNEKIVSIMKEFITLTLDSITNEMVKNDYK